jgi:ferredoxin-NADP reductase
MMDKIALIDRIEVASNTWEFQFRKPEGMNFSAGQSINLKLPELRYEDKKGLRRTFSISSAPNEKDITITTRMTGSGFKRTLAELDIGTELEYIGPKGEFTLHTTSGKAVFIAGGIGITPFRSMILDAHNRIPNLAITLLYSNNDLKSSTYHDLFDSAARQHANFHYVPTLTKLSPTDPSWNGERRQIDWCFIQDHLPDVDPVPFYLCGPPVMVEELTKLLGNHYPTKDLIYSESFWGY